jgi:hypothetical protein
VEGNHESKRRLYLKQDRNRIKNETNKISNAL